MGSISFENQIDTGCHIILPLLMSILCQFTFKEIKLTLIDLQLPSSVSVKLFYSVLFILLTVDTIFSYFFKEIPLL